MSAKRARLDNGDNSIKATPKRAENKLKSEPRNRTREERQAVRALVRSVQLQIIELQDIPTEFTLNPKAYCADDLLWVQQSKKAPHFPCTLYSCVCAPYNQGNRLSCRYERITGRWVVVWCGDNRHSVEKWSNSKFRGFEPFHFNSQHLSLDHAGSLTISTLFTIHSTTPMHISRR